MNSVENYAIRYLEPKDVKDLDQYNALLRYVFQVTEQELTSIGWEEKEIIRAKFPTMEKADVLGWFDGDEPGFPRGGDTHAGADFWPDLSHGG